MFKIVLIVVFIFFSSDGLERLHKQNKACNRINSIKIFRSTRLESSSDTTDKFDMFQPRTSLNDYEPTKSTYANEHLSSFIQNIKTLQGTPELVDRFAINVKSYIPFIAFHFVSKKIIG